MVPREIKNLIFDLGGVIMNLDTARTHRAFAQLAGTSVDEIKSKISRQTFLDSFEKGNLTDSEFRTQLRSFLNTSASDAEIDSAWNAMLLDIPKEKYRLLEELKTHYRVFLLSNTNNIHLQAVNQIVLNDTGRAGLGYYFHKDHYSHLMKMRKPDTEIFQQVLSENNLVAGETYFLDDNMDNINGAKSAGLQTVHIATPEMVLSLFA